MRLRFCAVRLALALTLTAAVSASVLFETAAPATASATEWQFNLLGWLNGSQWGNQGGQASVDWLWNDIVLYNSIGVYPTTVSTSETCWSVLDSDPNTQFHTLYGRLYFSFGGAMAY